MTRTQPEPEPPWSALETELAALWGRMLGRAQIGRDERFLFLGGDSLMAGQLVTQVSEAYGVELSLSDFFDAPTIAAQAAAVTLQLNGSQKPDSLAPGPADDAYDAGSL